MNSTQIEAIAKRTINIEINTLKQLSEQIGSSFVEAVKIINESKGRLLITGIGKSAIVGKKLVATMNSTGTSAIFMHAADAIHGDLGMLESEDIVLCISKSGETQEVKVLVPLIRNFGNPILSMTSNPDSYLAKSSNIHLYTPVSQEADPNNLAPTASTTAQMALGDALSVCLLALRGFSPEDFAQFHPGGSLGKQLYLKVEDLSKYNAKPSVSPNASIRDIILEISGKRLGATAVLENEKLLGIITDGDIRRMLENNESVNHLTAKEIMSKNPVSVQLDDYAVHAFQKMRSKNIHQLIVMSDKHYAGMIHIHDLIKEGIV